MGFKTKKLKKIRFIERYNERLKLLRSTVGIEAFFSLYYGAVFCVWDSTIPRNRWIEDKEQNVLWHSTAGKIEICPIELFTLDNESNDSNTIEIFTNNYYPKATRYKLMNLDQYLDSKRNFWF